MPTPAWDEGCPLNRSAKLIALSALLAGAGCSQTPSPVLDSDKVASVVVGRSSRNDVFAALGRPARTETTSTGESWVYATKDDGAGGQTLVNGATSAMGVAGAFVPYVGLAASSLGLASTAAGAARPPADSTSLTVLFGADGVVRDCVYASTASPGGLGGPGAGPGAGAPRAQGCRRPAATPGTIP